MTKLLNELQIEMIKSNKEIMEKIDRYIRSTNNIFRLYDISMKDTNLLIIQEFINHEKEIIKLIEKFLIIKLDGWDLQYDDLEDLLEQEGVI